MRLICKKLLTYIEFEQELITGKRKPSFKAKSLSFVDQYYYFTYFYIFLIFFLHCFFNCVILYNEVTDMDQIVNILAVTFLPLAFLLMAHFLNRHQKSVPSRKITQYWVKIPRTGYAVEI